MRDLSVLWMDSLIEVSGSVVVGCVCAQFSRQEYWGGLPFPSPEALPYPGTEPTSLESPVLASLFFTTVPPG